MISSYSVTVTFTALIVATLTFECVECAPATQPDSSDSSTSIASLTFKASPSEATVRIADQIIFSVPIPPPSGGITAYFWTYHWHFNGVPISGPNSASAERRRYVIEEADATTFSSISYPSDGLEIMSSIAVLRVYHKPRIIKHPEPFSRVNPGITVTYLCEASALPLSTYSWKFKGKFLEKENDRVLVIKNVSASSAGIYTCMAENSLGFALSQDAILKVNDLPKFTGPPLKDVTVDPGDRVVLVGTAEGTPFPNQIWMRNGTVIPGETSSHFVIVNAQESHEGEYSTRISNVMGTVESKPILLTVNDPPVILVEPIEMNVDPGDNFSLFSVISGSPYPSIVWRRSETVLPRPTASSGSQEQYLAITNAKESDEGYYTVTATNSAGQASSTPVFIEVRDPPRFKKDLNKKVYVAPGHSFTLGAEAEGSYELSYTWWFEGTVIAGKNTSTLTIASATEDMEGSYVLRVENKLGIAYSQPCLVRVIDKPSVTFSESNITISRFQSFALIAIVESAYPVTIQWYKDGRLLPLEKGMNLNVNKAYLSHSGFYSAKVSNHIGVTSSDKILVSVNGYDMTSKKMIDFCASKKNCDSCTEISKDSSEIQAGEICGFCGDSCNLVTIQSLQKCSSSYYSLYLRETTQNNEINSICPPPAVSGKSSAGDSSTLGTTATIVLCIVIFTICAAIFSVHRYLHVRRQTISQGKSKRDALTQLASMQMGEGVHFSAEVVAAHLKKLLVIDQQATHRKKMERIIPRVLSPEWIETKDSIGSGQFGQVRKGIFKDPLNTIAANNKTEVALKTLRDNPTEVDVEKFLGEASLMAQFNHNNVLALVGVVVSSNPVMIVSEFCAEGSLDLFLRNEDVSQAFRLQMAVDIASGMKYLDECGFVHRDLASRNILLTAEKECKVCDFGLSKEYDESTDYYTSEGGVIAIRWTAPEALHYKKFSRQTDVWSYGVLLWEIWTNAEMPYGKVWSNMKVLVEIEKGFRMPCPDMCPRAVYLLMMQCWNPASGNRPTFQKLLASLSGLRAETFEVFGSKNSNEFQGMYQDGYHLAGTDKGDYCYTDSNNISQLLSPGDSPKSAELYLTPGLHINDTPENFQNSKTGTMYHLATPAPPSRQSMAVDHLDALTMHITPHNLGASPSPSIKSHCSEFEVNVMMDDDEIMIRDDDKRYSDKVMLSSSITSPSMNGRSVIKSVTLTDKKINGIHAHQINDPGSPLYEKVDLSVMVEDDPCNSSNVSGIYDSDVKPMEKSAENEDSPILSKSSEMISSPANNSVIIASPSSKPNIFSRLQKEEASETPSAIYSMPKKILPPGLPPKLKDNLESTTKSNIDNNLDIKQDAQLPEISTLPLPEQINGMREFCSEITQNSAKQLQGIRDVKVSKIGEVTNSKNPEETRRRRTTVADTKNILYEQLRAEDQEKPNSKKEELLNANIVHRNSTKFKFKLTTPLRSNLNQ
eukprot:UC4_evm1s1421